ncbi:MAG TPA: monovalent cation:proton antiporter-2 (CPA2) family protein [Devosiaceae bacterium]
MDTSLLFAIFVLLAAIVALVPLSRFFGLSTILGYLAAGILVGPYGLRLISDTDTIRHVSEFGVVMMLFLVGLELQPAEIWRMRNKVMGLGLSQFVLTALIVAALAHQLGVSWQVATIVGLTLSMSSTAIALQTIAQRSIMQTDAGRGGLAILLVQDIAVIPVLAAIPLLSFSGGTPEVPTNIWDPAQWRVAAEIVGVFVLTILAGRYLVRPVLRFVAETGVREGFTALALALVVGASVLMMQIGLSPALGAFMGGVLLADSEYRHELEGTLEPFKGLLLGLFFISVGMSIAFSVLYAQPLEIIGVVLGLMAVKGLVLFALATLFRMHLADRILMAILLCQGGEFAFLVLQFARDQGSLAQSGYEFLIVAVALSMLLTPLLIFAFDKLVAPRIGTRSATRAPDTIDTRQKVIVLGYGRFGQIVTRMLRAQGYEMTLIDDDPAQIELVKRFGVKVFYGDGGRLDLLDAAGAADAQLIVIAVGERERITAIAQMVRRHFPKVKVAARAVDRSHAHDLMDAGVDIAERETFHSAVSLGTRALVALGYLPHKANRLAHAFVRHDYRILNESRDLRHDETAYVGYMRSSIEMLNEVMRADRSEHGENAAGDWMDDFTDIDNGRQDRTE